MSATNAQLARRWFDEVWNARRVELIDDLLAYDCSGFMQGVGYIEGSGQFKARMGEILQALPDLYIAIDDIIGEGDKAAVRWTARATHADGFGAPATGRKVRIYGLIWMEFQDGKIKHAWDGWNHDGLIRLILAPEEGDGVI
jgi:steroid delta-isomerase-like uncharacterized protein